MGNIGIQDVEGYSNIKVAFDSRYPHRWYDAWGEVEKFVSREFTADDWTATATNTSTFDKGVLRGIFGLITTENIDFAGINAQLNGTKFSIAAGKPLYFGAKLEVDDDDEIDVLVGLCGTDTTLMSASSSHAIAVSAGGIFFSKLDHVTGINFKTYTTGTEVNTAAVGTISKTAAQVYEFYWDGVSTLTAWLDGVVVAKFTSGITTEVLTPSICVRAGEAGVKTCKVHWIRAIQAL